MAGFYPDVPGRRVPWDRDGSVLGQYDYSASSFVGLLSAANRQNLNDESQDTIGFSSGNFSAGGCFVVLFPRLYTILGWYLGFGKNASPASSLSAKEPYLQWSPNTTNGIDGTWTTLSQLSLGTAAVNFDSPVKMRQNIAVIGTPLTAAKAMRFGFRDLSAFGSCHCTSWHIYGTPTDNTRLAIWHPTLDQEHAPAYFDWGDVPRTSVLTRDFRVKNLTAQTANGVVLSKEALSELSPAVIPQLKFTTDGVTFTDTVSIGTMAPGAISSVITVRYAVDAAAALSLGWQRMIAAAASFT